MKRKYKPLIDEALTDEALTDEALTDETLPSEEEKNEARASIRKRRFQGLTKLDKLYIKEGNYNAGHDPVAWYTTHKFKDVSTEGVFKRNAMFLCSLESILRQATFDHLSKADDLYLQVTGDSLKNHEPMKALLESPNTGEFVLRRLQDDSGTMSVTDLELYIDALEEMLQLKRADDQHLFKYFDKKGPMAAVNRHYINYLRSCLVSLERRDDLKAALTDGFLRNLHSLENTEIKSDEHSDNVELYDLYENQKQHNLDLRDDLFHITDAYLGDDRYSANGWYPLTQDHHYKCEIKTEAGECFAKVIHHITTIDCAAALADIPEILKQSYNNDYRARGEASPAEVINDVPESLYSAFIKIQNSYYQRVKNYYEKAVLKIYQMNNPEAEGLKMVDIPMTMLDYYDQILFGNDPARVNELFDELIDFDFNRQYLKQAEHSLLCELQPALIKQKKAAEIELKHLKKNINHFVQAVGLHSQLKKREPNQSDPVGAFFTMRYRLTSVRNRDNFLIRAAKQQKRFLNDVHSFWGVLFAVLVGMGEGTVAGVALAVAIPIVSAAIVLGGIVFLSGWTLNYFLLKLDTIGLFKALGFNSFNKAESGLPLAWYSKLLNYASATLSFLGTGFVFAAVFAIEFLKMAHHGLNLLPKAVYLVAMPAAVAVATVIGLAELFGISALIHMANNKMIKQGLNKLGNDIASYFYRRFYVAMPEEWNSVKGTLKNLGEIVKNLPRLLVSTILTVAGLAVMAYYIKMTFIFFSGCVTSLIAMIPFFQVGAAAAAAVTMGKVVAGINVVTTFMTFTLPLGKIVMTILELALKGAFLTVALSAAAGLAILMSPALPYLCCKSEKGVGQVISDYFATFKNTAIEFHSWLTSNSILVPGGLDRSLMIDAEREAAQQKDVEVLPTHEATERLYPELGYVEAKGGVVDLGQTKQIKQNVDRSTWIKTRIVYPFFLLANSLGQAFLFLANGLASLKNAIHVLEAAIQGTRSGAMNLKGVGDNIAIAPGGNPMTMFKAADEGRHDSSSLYEEKGSASEMRFLTASPA